MPRTSRWLGYTGIVFKIILAALLVYIGAYVSTVGLLVSYDSALRVGMLALLALGVLAVTLRLFIRKNFLLLLPVLAVIGIPVLSHFDFTIRLKEECVYFKQCTLSQNREFICDGTSIITSTDIITERCIKNGYWTHDTHE